MIAGVIVALIPLCVLFVCLMKEIVKSAKRIRVLKAQLKALGR